MLQLCKNLITNMSSVNAYFKKTDKHQYQISSMELLRKFFGNQTFIFRNHVETCGKKSTGMFFVSLNSSGSNLRSKTHAHGASPLSTHASAEAGCACGNDMPQGQK